MMIELRINYLRRIYQLNLELNLRLLKYSLIIELNYSKIRICISCVLDLLKKTDKATYVLIEYSCRIIEEGEEEEISLV